MDQAGRVDRKQPSPETLRTASALYRRKGGSSFSTEAAGSSNLEHVGAIIKDLAAVYGRDVDVRAFAGEIAVTFDDGEEVRIASPRALSMVEDVRFLLSPILDRKA